MLQNSIRDATENIQGNFQSILIGAGVLALGSMPALAAGDVKTYTNYLNFLTNDFKFNFFLAHGYNMWIAWVGLGVTQISSTRYLKGTYPKFNMWVHQISGTLMVLITLYFGVNAALTVGKDGATVLASQDVGHRRP